MSDAPIISIIDWIASTLGLSGLDVTIIAIAGLWIMAWLLVGLSPLIARAIHPLEKD